MKTFLNYLLRVSAACALLAGLGYLYLAAYPADSGQSETTAGLLGELKKIDAAWNADVLRSKNGQIKDYDAVTAPQSSALQVLDRIAEENLGRFDVRLADAQTVLRETIVTKSDLIDRFKRESAIMRNSLRYIPAAAAELKAKLREVADATPQKRAQLDALASVVDQILNDATRLEAGADRTQARRLDTAVGRLTVNRAEYPPAIWPPFDIFTRHATQIATQTEREMETLDALARVPLQEYADALDRDARRAFARADTERNAYRFGLYAYAGLLLALLAFLAARMWLRGRKPGAAASPAAAPRVHAASRA